MSKENIKEQILDIVSEVLGLSIDEISSERRLQDYGMDSIIGVEMVSMLNKMYDLNLHKTAVYSYPTVNKLTAYIVDSLEKNGIIYQSDEDEYNNIALGRYGRRVGEEGSVTGSYSTEKKSISNVLDEVKIEAMIAKLSCKYGEIPEEVYKECTEMDQLAQRISDYLNLRDNFDLKKKEIAPVLQ